WSWTYFDNNECYDENGVNLWQWMSRQSREDTVVATGTQKAYVVGEDWGPAVSKTVIKLDKAIDADSVVAENLRVVEEKNATNWGENPDVAFGKEYIKSADRKVTKAYTSDENGNETTKASKYLTIEMYISPNDGSPFIYSLATGFNSWCNPYRLHVSLAKGAQLTSGDEIVSELDVTADIDVAGDGKICPQLDKINVYEKSFKASDGTVYSYADYAPAKDDKKNALVIWLHGAGEGKYDPSIDILGNEVTAYVTEEFQKEFGNAYVLVPQCPTMWMDDGTGAYQHGDKGSCYKDSLMELIKDYVSSNDDIDNNRIVIGGCSNGGYMTMEMILANPDYFAAAFPICEAFEDQYITDEQIESIKDMGIWFTYAKTDTTVDFTKCTEPTVKRLLAAGAKNIHVSAFDDVHDTTGRFTNVDGTPYTYNGHWSWIYFDNNECYDENGVNAWEWLGKQVKASAEISEPGKDNQNKPSTSVKTGDDTVYAGYALLLMAAAAGYTVLKRKEN
ncbi:MAG: prolyl oligopeptidase family serine peptidase, partial [Faecalibacillus sp.]